MVKKTNEKLFLELAKPNDEGFSRRVSVKEFIGEYSALVLGNGGSWCRKNVGLGKTYNIVRHKLEKGNKISHIELVGFNKNYDKHVISKKVRDHFKGKKCVVLNISSDIQIDHKDGRNDDDKVNDPKTQKVTDFQPLSAAVNAAKRTHCKKCRKTGIRFNAKELGYILSHYIGNNEYQGTCVGCYWYDPIKFNKELSKDTEVTNSPSEFLKNILK